MILQLDIFFFPAETFAQELDLERKARQQQSAQQNQQQSQHSERDIKSPVPGMYKNLCFIHYRYLPTREFKIINF